MESPRFRFTYLFIMAILLVGCGSDQAEEATTDSSETEAADIQLSEPGVVNVSATEYEFRAGSTFPSGWVTLRFRNEGEEPHFLLIWKLPQDRTFEEYAAEVATPFQELYGQYRAGTLDQATFLEQLTAAIPPWFFEAVPMGGPGITAPGRTSETTVFLEPGDNYVLECYVRSAVEDDRFHGSEGMLRPLVVSDEATGTEPPEADVDITISNEGLVVAGELTAGTHVARISVEDTPEGFVRHNAHLARLDSTRTPAMRQSGCSGWMRCCRRRPPSLSAEQDRWPPDKRATSRSISNRAVTHGCRKDGPRMNSSIHSPSNSRSPEPP